MRQQGHDWDAVWGSIKHMIAKSLIAIQPILQYYYRSATRQDDEGFSCFEVGAPHDLYFVAFDARHCNKMLPIAMLKTYSETLCS